MKFKLNSNKGFSLLELLIVISIMGILTTVVLNSLSKSRAKGYDSKIQQQLVSFRTAAEMFYQIKGRYNIGSGSGTTVDCTSNNSVFKDTNPDVGAPGKFIDPSVIPSSTIVCQANNNVYAVKILLYSGTNYWCVDSLGSSKLTSDGTAITYCP